MFKKIKLSFKFLHISFQYMKRDPELIFYTILSMISEILILVSFAIIWYFSWFSEFLKSIENENLVYIISVFLIFMYYFIFSTIAFFFNTAIITSVQRRLSWQENIFSDGIKDAFKNIKKIIIWAFINATVSTFLKLLQDKFWKDSWIWALIIWMIWWMWNILTYFSFPLMILENKSVKESINESSQLFKKTWWERAILNVSISFWIFIIILLLMIIFFASIFMLASSGNFFMIIVLSFLFFTTIISLSIFSYTATSIINIILLNYAKTWRLPKIMKLEDILQIAKQKEQN